MKQVVPRDLASYNAAIRRQVVKSGDAGSTSWQGVLDLLSAMRRDAVHPSQISYGMAIDACGRASAWAGSVALLDELRSRMRLPGLRRPGRACQHPSLSVACNAAISACARGRQWSQAMALFAEMRGRTIADNVSYNAAITACARGSQWARASLLLVLLRRGRITPDLVGCNAAIAACATASAWPAALALLVNMLGLHQQRRLAWPSPDVRSFNSTATALERSFHMSRAVALMNDMAEVGVRPDVFTLGALLTACGSASRWWHAMRLLDDFRDRAVLPDRIACNSAVTACAAGAAWPLALQLLWSTTPDVVTLNAAISALTRGTQWASAVSLLDYMGTARLQPTAVTSIAVLGAWAEGSQWAAALHYLQMWQTNGAALDTLSCNAALSACAQAGQWVVACACLASMHIMRIARDSVSYGIVAGACCNREAQGWRRALALLHARPQSCCGVSGCSLTLRACELSGRRHALHHALAEIVRGKAPTYSRRGTEQGMFLAAETINLEVLALEARLEAHGVASLSALLVLASARHLRQALQAPSSSSSARGASGVPSFLESNDLAFASNLVPAGLGGRAWRDVLESGLVAQHRCGEMLGFRHVTLPGQC
eukprot:TRINITY_DN6668_c0_g1_i1.p1 TRINITY_DN6668_c0_g1~~TRINITY_DN6668_c0_g1_i1.p1  ORF type:complete len:604 (-),score=71.74 TRINITY_DN6668_c0_g1_i1:64-1875(-)